MTFPILADGHISNPYTLANRTSVETSMLMFAYGGTNLFTVRNNIDY